MTARPTQGSEGRIPWEDLLRTEGSLLASVAAAGLDGLRGTLRAALVAAPADRGADACTTLLHALERLLAEAWQGEPARPGVTQAGSPTAGVHQPGSPLTEAHQAGSPPAGVPQAGSLPAGFAQAGGLPAGVHQPGAPLTQAHQARSLPAGYTQAVSPATGSPTAVGPTASAPQQADDPNGSAGPRVPPRPAAPPRTAAPAILGLAAELAGSPEVDDFAIGAVPPAADGPGGTDRVRRWYHLTLLRLPDRHAGVWRTRAAEADPAPPEPWQQPLRGWADEILLPPSDDGRRGIRTVRTKVTEPSDLAGLVLALLEHDEALCLLLDGVWTGGSTRLSDPQVSQAYRGELAKRLKSLERSPQGGTERLRASVSVDEALCSVTHLPPGAPGSWWNRLAEESHAVPLDLCRQLLAAGRNVEAVLPPRSYRQARPHTRAGDDIRLGVGGRPGDTLACLRLWLRVDDQVFPGRVVHRGQE
ncbi:hypothetical protein [Streptomyces bicolor]|uniref:hypothetical protein n=1 Tax=Streptomyces bicolor TaxID=66874 RepID=UPI00131E8F01|nr:hypothetical protein [Streptomyces bicolor]